MSGEDMADYTAVRAVSETLKSLLEEHITNSTNADLNGIPIDLRSPKEIRQALVTPVVSVWLYRVVRDGDLVNRPSARNGYSQVQRRQIPLDLYYLITPLAADARDEHTLLGRVLQTLNDHSQLRSADLQGTLQNDGAELRITLEMLTLEELTRVWHALQEPYDLSVTYLAQVISIDSDHEPIRVEPVETTEIQYTQILSVN